MSNLSIHSVSELRSMCEACCRKPGQLSSQVHEQQLERDDRPVCANFLSGLLKSKSQSFSLKLLSFLVAELDIQAMLRKILQDSQLTQVRLCARLAQGHCCCGALQPNHVF